MRIDHTFPTIWGSVTVKTRDDDWVEMKWVNPENEELMCLAINTGGWNFFYDENRRRHGIDAKTVTQTQVNQLIEITALQKLLRSSPHIFASRARKGKIVGAGFIDE